MNVSQILKKSADLYIFDNLDLSRAKQLSGTSMKFLARLYESILKAIALPPASASVLASALAAAAAM